MALLPPRSVQHPRADRALDGLHLVQRLRVVRMVDTDRNALVYLTYSDKLIDGSPKNSVSAVPIPASTPIPVK